MKDQFRKMRIDRKDSRPGTEHLTIHDDPTPWISFPSLDQQGWVSCAFSTRLGGVSAGEVGSLNLAFSREKDEENVRENFRRITKSAGFDEQSMVFSWQTHTTNIRRVYREDAGKGYTKERDYQDVDGLITNEEGLTLVTFYADCVPVFAADPVHRAIGCAHSGWRGTAGNIGGKLIRAMEREFGTRPEDTVCAIGPSICQECYEVSEDVISQMREVYDPSIRDRLWYARGNGKYQLDLWECCRVNFLRAGVKEENVHRPDLCTCCNPELLYSHRKSKGRRGSLAAFMSIRSAQ